MQPTPAQDLRLTLVQRASSLDQEHNRVALEALSSLRGTTDVVVLPEASARDFGEPGSDLAAAAEALDGPYANAVRALADEMVVIAGMFETSADATRPYNTLVASGPGLEARYRKIHLYDSFGFRESDQLHPGPIAPVTIELKGLTAGLMTCYDLRFPELARMLVAGGAQMLVVPSAWVAGPDKLDHWRTLLRARAIENVAFVVAAAQPGPRYTGHSMVVSPTGEVLAEAGEGEETVTVSIDPEAVERARHRNPSLENRRM